MHCLCARADPDSVSCRCVLSCCLSSLRHNETLNVWSEFIPAIVFFVVFWELMYADTVLLAASDTDRVFVALGMIGALVFRPICSGCAHLFYPQNERSYVIWSAKSAQHSPAQRRSHCGKRCPMLTLWFCLCVVLCLCQVGNRLRVNLHLDLLYVRCIWTLQFLLLAGPAKLLLREFSRFALVDHHFRAVRQLQWRAHWKLLAVCAVCDGGAILVYSGVEM